LFAQTSFDEPARGLREKIGFRGKGSRRSRHFAEKRKERAAFLLAGVATLGEFDDVLCEWLFERADPILLEKDDPVEAPEDAIG
jgi:hypothetical protein